MNKKGRQMREKCDHSEPSPAIMKGMAVHYCMFKMAGITKGLLINL